MYHELYNNNNNSNNNKWVCGWGATFAFYMRAFVALRLMLVARMPSFANRRLAESPDIRL